MTWHQRLWILNALITDDRLIKRDHLWSFIKQVLQLHSWRFRTTTTNLTPYIKRLFREIENNIFLTYIVVMYNLKLLPSKPIALPPVWNYPSHWPFLHWMLLCLLSSEWVHEFAFQRRPLPHPGGHKQHSEMWKSLPKGLSFLWAG